MIKTGYFAYAVRGVGGENADITDMRHNISKGIILCNQLRSMLPDFEIYCPHEHEDLFQVPYRMGLINPDQIMKQCLSIEALCDVLFVCYDPEKSKGVMAELLFAQRNGIEIVELWRLPMLEWPEYVSKWREVA